MALRFEMISPSVRFNGLTWQQVGSVMGADSQPAVGAALKSPIVQGGPLPTAVHVNNLTAMQEILPYQWVHPDQER